MREVILHERQQIFSSISLASAFYFVCHVRIFSHDKLKTNQLFPSAYVEEASGVSVRLQVHSG
jgi:hypothetical protein